MLRNITLQVVQVQKIIAVTKCNMWKNHTYNVRIRTKKSHFYRDFENVNAILFFIESYFIRQHRRSQEKTELAKFVIIQHIENHIHRKEKVSKVEGGTRY